MDESNIKQKLANIFLKSLWKLNNEWQRDIMKSETSALLSNYKDKCHIVDYRIKIDTENNTPAIIDMNKLIAKVWIMHDFEYIQWKPYVIVVGSDGININGDLYNSEDIK